MSANVVSVFRWRVTSRATDLAEPEEPTPGLVAADPPQLRKTKPGARDLFLFSSLSLNLIKVISRKILGTGERET